MNGKVVIDVVVNGLEKLEKLIDIEKELSVFKADLGNGISFEGTKSDFKVFTQELAEMSIFVDKMNQINRNKY